MRQDITNHLWGFALKRHVDQMGNGRFCFYNTLSFDFLHTRLSSALKEAKIMEQYYIPQTTGEGDMPLLNQSTRVRFYGVGRIEDPPMIQWVMAPPETRNPRMTDHLRGVPIKFSQRIIDVLKPMNISTLQYLPSEILLDNEVIGGYYSLMVLKQIDAMGKGKDNRQSDYYKFDQKILQEIPLEERLVFKQLHKSNSICFHESVVAAIMSLKPTGLRFLKAKDWSMDRLFDSKIHDYENEW